MSFASTTQRSGSANGEVRMTQISDYRLQISLVPKALIRILIIRSDRQLSRPTNTANVLMLIRKLRWNIWRKFCTSKLLYLIRLSMIASTEVKYSPFCLPIWIALRRKQFMLSSNRPPSKCILALRKLERIRLERTGVELWNENSEKIEISKATLELLTFSWFVHYRHWNRGLWTIRKPLWDW